MYALNNKFRMPQVKPSKIPNLKLGKKGIISKLVKIPRKEKDLLDDKKTPEKTRTKPSTDR